MRDAVTLARLRSLVWACCAVALGVAALPATALACGASRGHVVAHSKKVRVYWVSDDGERAYRACEQPRGRPVALGLGAMDSGYPEKFQIAGRFLAYGDGLIDRHTGDADYRVHVLDVHRRADRWAWAFGLAQVPGRPADDLDLRGIHLRPNGAVAFLVGPIDLNGGAAYASQVWMAEPGRGRRLLDSSLDIDLKSFAVTGRQITWRHGSDTRTTLFSKLSDR